jgi:hypothetical protein
MTRTLAVNLDTLLNRHQVFSGVVARDQASLLRLILY